MADVRPFDITHRALTIPTLVGLLFASFLAPRFSSSGASPVRQQGTLVTATQFAAPTNALTADDLLTDYFGVDRNEIKESLHQTVADAAALHKTSVHFLIATVSDPIDSYETWQFDPQVDAIRQGIEASGYLFDRFYLPGTGIDPKTDAEKAAALRDLHTHWPGVILFRWTNKNIPPPDPNDHSVLVTFLIPETPVAGIHQEPFRRALEFIYAWMREHPELASPDEGIRILGPTYSGSTQSLVRGLVNYDRTLPPVVPYTTVSIVSGSASNDRNRSILEQDTRLKLHALSVSFRATMQSNTAVAKGLEDFLTSAGIEGLSASLSESSTAYGNDIADRAHAAATEQQPPLSIKFPFNIAQLRRDAGRDSSTKTDPPAGGVSSFRPLALDDATVPTDQLPLQTPSTTSSSVELVLSNMLDAIHREHVRIVRLDATDIRDKLFLIKELRSRAPDVLIVSTDADLFQVHPDQAQWLRGLLLSSTYPLHTSSQTLVYPFRGAGAAARPNGELVQFASVNMQGYYNAAIALLNYHIHDGMPASRFKDEWDWVPKLIDYGGIGPKKDDCPRGEPGVWISVVGDGEIVPLHVACRMDSVVTSNDGGAYPYVFVPNINDSTAEPPSVHQVSASNLTILLIVFVLTVSMAACGFALARASNVGAERLGAIGLGLCGVLVPVATLGTISVAAASELWQGDAFWPLLRALLAALACFGAAIYIVYFQFKSRTLRLVRLFFAGVAVLSAAYVVLQLDDVPQIFLLRVLDVGTRMSPLLPLVAFGGVAIALAGVELRRLQSFGIGGTPGNNGGKVPDARKSWAAAVDSIAGEATFGLSGIRDALVKSHDRLFFLPFGSRPLELAWASTPIAVALIAHFVMFPSLDRPILTVEGPLFAWTLVLIITFLNWVFVTALTQFLCLAWSTAQLLLRLGRHPGSLPWDTVPREHAAIGLVPKAPRLHDLTPLAAEIPNGLTILQRDLDEQPPKRWFESETWTNVNSELNRLTGPAAGQIGSADRAARLSAMKVVFVVRELLSRLSFNVLTMGPLLVLLIVLYWTVYFDRSHVLLGLIWFDVLIAMAAIMSVFVWIDRDVVISGIRGTTPGAIDWNWDFLSKILLYVVLPLLTLFATQFPDIGSSVMRFLQPVQRLPGS